ncbi:aquaporin Z [Caballeronia sordidicola]|uniref:Aquaporin Z n=2 Tax=Caballeronia sordidicola TaxID=196367 RepID=A0A158F6Q7_CABSO|nr:aquaporin Z [Caballeronia sordidicola]
MGCVFAPKLERLLPRCLPSPRLSPRGSYRQWSSTQGSEDDMFKKLLGECLGTFSLVFFGCGCTALAGGYFRTDVGLICQAVAFGLAATTLVYVLRPISSAHFNPAVTVGFAIANRFPVRDLMPTIAAQVGGAIAGAWLLYVVASARPGASPGLVALGVNGYGAHSPARYQLHAALIVEVLMTFVFVLVNLAVTSGKRMRIGGAALIGLSLTLCSLLAIPVTNASINPARSTGPALVMGGWALDQLWLFWAAPLGGGVLAGFVFPMLQRNASASNSKMQGTSRIGGALDNQPL